MDGWMNLDECVKWHIIWMNMTYNSGDNVLMGNLNFELHLSKLKTNYNHVMSTCIVEN
jgi:hypothetical protein